MARTTPSTGTAAVIRVEDSSSGRIDSTTPSLADDRAYVPQPVAHAASKSRTPGLRMRSDGNESGVGSGDASDWLDHSHDACVD